MVYVWMNFTGWWRRRAIWWWWRKKWRRTIYGIQRKVIVSLSPKWQLATTCYAEEHLVQRPNRQISLEYSRSCAGKKMNMYFLHYENLHNKKCFSIDVLSTNIGRECNKKPNNYIFHIFSADCRLTIVCRLHIYAIYATMFYFSDM